MTRLLTLAVDIDVLLSSATATDAESGWCGPEPSFTYSITTEPPPTPLSSEHSTAGPSPQPKGTSGDVLAVTRYAWLRPGVRRFLLTAQPHFRTVLFVRRKCSVRRCPCSSSSSSASSSSSSARPGDQGEAVQGGGTGTAGPSCGGGGGSSISGTSIGGGSAADGRHGAGGCSAALLKAALPNIDPDGQFFGNRVVLVQDRPRPRTAQPRLTAATGAEGLTASSVSSGLASARPVRRPLAAVAAQGSNELGQVFPAQARDLSALASALGERPAGLLIVTVANRSLFGVDLCDQVVECQPYRKEYGKYDDVLDGLSSVVSDLLVAASVPQGLRQLGLLHSTLEPSPMMQTLHAQMALRQAQGQGRLAPPPPPPQQQQQVAGPQAPPSAAAAPEATPHRPGLAQQVCSLLTSRTGATAAAEKRLQQGQQPPAASTATSSSKKHSGRMSRLASRTSPDGRKSDPGNGSGGGGGGTSSKARGGISRSTPMAPLLVTASAASMSCSAASSPLPPIPEQPMLEAPADSEGDEPAAPTAAGAAPAPAQSDRASGGSSSAESGSCASVSSRSSHPGTHKARSNSSPNDLFDSYASPRNGPSRSSDGSPSSSGSCSGPAVLAAAAAAAPAPPPMTPCGRRTAWDADPSALHQQEGGQTGGLLATVDLSATAALLQRLKPSAGGTTTAAAAAAGAAATAGGGGAAARPPSGFVRAHAGGDLGWRPSSFPAAAKPPVTRHISDCATQTGGPTAASGEGSASAAGPAAPASPLTAAASAVAAATTRLFSRFLGGRRKRRCRPSDAGEDGVTAVVSGGGGGGAPRRSAVSATLAARAWSDTGEAAAAGAVSVYSGRSAADLAGPQRRFVPAAAAVVANAASTGAAAAGLSASGSTAAAAAAELSFARQSAPHHFAMSSLPSFTAASAARSSAPTRPVAATSKAAVVPASLASASPYRSVPQLEFLEVPVSPGGPPRCAGRQRGDGSEPGRDAADGSPMLSAARATACLRRHSEASGTLRLMLGNNFSEYIQAGEGRMSQSGLRVRVPARGGEQPGKQASAVAACRAGLAARCDPRVGGSVGGTALRVLAAGGSDAADEALLEGLGRARRCAGEPGRGSFSGTAVAALIGGGGATAGVGLLQTAAVAL